MLFTLIYGVSIDCPSVISLARSLNVQLGASNLMLYIEYDCCVTSYTRVTCENDRVVEINWIGRQLDGIVNMTAIPPLTRRLDLSSNDINGPLTSIANSLVFVDLSFNSINGSLPLFSPNLVSLDVSENKFSGSIPMPNNKLEGLSVVSNLLSGTIPALPSSLLYLYLHNNQFSGSMPILPLGLHSLVLGYGSIGCGISGSLYINSVVFLFIPNNYITNLYISQPETIQNCDISNNPLLNRLNAYTNLPCYAVNLYSATMDSNYVEPSQTTQMAFLVADSTQYTTMYTDFTAHSSFIHTSLSKSTLMSTHTTKSIAATRITRHIQASSTLVMSKTFHIVLSSNPSAISTTSATNVTNATNSSSTQPIEAFINLTIIYISWTIKTYITLFINTILVEYILYYLYNRHKKRKPKSELTPSDIN